ncbi:MAG: hypothetical protein K0R43_2613 [Pseudoduganella sp.]|jgi:hypothetical protein|nr:hypothetical protein [Pseudoduganella sp.]
MKKLFAAFLFAVGMGASLSAAAGSCEYWCAVDLENCSEDGNDYFTCYAQWERCWTSCGNDIP